MQEFRFNTHGCKFVLSHGYGKSMLSIAYKGLTHYLEGSIADIKSDLEEEISDIIPLSAYLKAVSRLV